MHMQSSLEDNHWQPQSPLHAGHPADVDVVRWHPNGHYLATGSDKQLRLWDLRSGACVRVIVGHTDVVSPG